MGVVKHADRPGIRNVIVIDLQWLVDTMVELLSKRSIGRNVLRTELRRTIGRPSQRSWSPVTRDSLRDLLKVFRLKWTVLRAFSAWMKRFDTQMKDSGVIDVDEITDIAWWPARPSSEKEWTRFQTTGRLKSSLLEDIWPKLQDMERPVSYTHLTLPTICSV